MDRLIVTGGTRLSGSVRLAGAKNSALKLMAAALLAPGRTTLRNVPRIQDCLTMADVLEHLGESIHWDGSSLGIDASEVRSVEAPYELVSRMRASILVLGPLLARCGHARVAMPGGCNIGSRKIDLHLKGLQKMGATFRQEHGFLEGRADRLRGAVILEGARPDHMDLVLDKLADAGARIDVRDAGVEVALGGRPRAVDLVTLPYPGFPTDLQPQIMALLAAATGTSIVTENVFESRFMFVDELNRMGADIRTEGHHAVIRGVGRLSAAPVLALDIRAGAAMVIAALAAEGVTAIEDMYHVDRGYQDFEANLTSLGAEVRREREPTLVP